MFIQNDADNKITLTLNGDVDVILNNIKVLVDGRFTLESKPNGVSTQFQGNVNLDFIDEIITLQLEPK